MTVEQAVAAVADTGRPLSFARTRIALRELSSNCKNPRLLFLVRHHPPKLLRVFSYGKRSQHELIERHPKRARLIFEILRDAIHAEGGD